MQTRDVVLVGGILSNAPLCEYPANSSEKRLFTGLVETMGQVLAVTELGAARRFTIDTGELDFQASLGDSIAISGCCLTVVGMNDHKLEFDAGEETLSKTTLGQLQKGSLVNLERALAVGDRLGGHYVTGHVDATVSLVQREDDFPWSHLRFSLPIEFSRQVASKGSVTIDGVSLTVVDARDDSFGVALIPHTLQVTTLGRLAVGDRVNFETDVLAKYVARLLAQ